MMQPKSMKAKPTVRKTVSVSASDIEFIKETVTSLSQKIETMSVTLNDVNGSVIGNTAYGQTGLIKRVQEHEDYIEKDKSFKAKLIGGGLVIGAMWTFVLKFFERFFE